MSSVPYDVIAASKPFRFLVGPDKKEFFMHTELIARISMPLSALVNGEWKESLEGVVELPETDEKTFVRFCEFAYTGDYKAAEPPVLPKVEKSSIDSSQGLNKKKKKKRYAEQATADFGLGSFPAPPPSPPPPLPPGRDSMWKEFMDGINDGLDKSQKDSSNIGPSANCSEVLLCHAQLYVFADCYAIYDLMRLCTQRLRCALGSFDLHSGGELNQARVADVVQLIDLLFRNTRGKDEVRGLLATYMACKVEDLWTNTYFHNVLESSGEVSKALIGQLMRRLN
ncbi:hypothetical protein F5B19DRAFT_130261 [Rostrohypoxylon terebratum]|nr:hypothetical protein F5B19DRAFT_130261 [Rostrohypoxylon terebratum]